MTTTFNDQPPAPIAYSPASNPPPPPAQPNELASNPSPLQRPPTPPTDTFTSTISSRRSSHFDVILGTTQPTPTSLNGSPYNSFAEPNGHLSNSTAPASPSSSSHFQPLPPASILEPNGVRDGTNSPMSLSSLVGPGNASFVVPPTNGFDHSTASSPGSSSSTPSANPFPRVAEAGSSRPRASLPSNLSISAGPPSPPTSTSLASSRKRQRPSVFGEETGSSSAAVPAGPSTTKPLSTRPKREPAKPRVSAVTKRKAGALSVDAGSVPSLDDVASGSRTIANLPTTSSLNPQSQNGDIDPAAALLLSLNPELGNNPPSVSTPSPALPTSVTNPSTPSVFQHSPSLPPASASAPVSPPKAAATAFLPPPLPDLPPAFASLTPATHLPFIVPFPAPFNSAQTPLVPTLKSTLQTSLLPLMNPTEKRIAFALEMLPIEFLKTKADLEMLMDMGGEEEDVRGVVEGWKSGDAAGKGPKKRNVAKLGRREKGRIVLEYLVGETTRKREEMLNQEQVVAPVGDVEEPKVDGEMQVETEQPLEENVEPVVAVVETPLEAKEEEKVELAAPVVVVVEAPKQQQDEPMEEETKIDEAEAARIREAKGKGKAKGVEMGQLAYTVESREIEKYAVWVFLKGYLEAKEVEKTDVRSFVKPLPESTRNDITAIIRSVKPPAPLPPRKSGKPHKTPKLGPFGPLSFKLLPVVPPLPALHDPYSSAAYSSLFSSTGAAADQISLDEQHMRMLKFEAQLLKAKEQQRARELKWMEKREPRKSLPVPVVPKPAPREKEKKIPAAKRRKMEADALIAASAEWRYEIYEELGKGINGRTTAIKSIHNRDPSKSHTDVVTLSSFNAMLATTKADLGKIVYETYQSSPCPPPTNTLFTAEDLTLFPAIQTLFLTPLPHGNRNPSALFKSSKDISPEEMELFYPAMFHSIERKWKEEGRIRDLLMLNALYKTAQVKRSAMRKAGVYIFGRGVGGPSTQADMVKLRKREEQRGEREGTGDSGATSTLDGTPAL
ncbi:hypothetical protein BDY24DRAFT_416141 [Mrakia frigida]|uniref:uncharacterized protein n=1 Tax=Mrakia frigida TaxID=29902 RepID=UPI003FCBFCC8